MKEREIRRNQAEELGEGRWTNGGLKEESEENRKKRMSNKRGEIRKLNFRKEREKRRKRRKGNRLGKRRS